MKTIRHSDIPMERGSRKMASLGPISSMRIPIKRFMLFRINATIVMMNPVAMPGLSLKILDTRDMVDGNTMEKKSPEILMTKR